MLDAQASSVAHQALLAAERGEAAVRLSDLLLAAQAEDAARVAALQAEAQQLAAHLAQQEATSAVVREVSCAFWRCALAISLSFSRL